MKRYLVNISFKNNMPSFVTNIAETVKTRVEAIEYISMIDNTVERAIIRDNNTGKVEWFKGEQIK